MDDEQLDRLIAEASRGSRPYVDTIKVHQNVNLVIAPDQSVHFGNHSCDPNLWHVDAYTVAARRQIERGEELTIDYATQTEGDFRMECRCGSPMCRKVVTGKDWQRADLRERYGDHWVPAVLEKVRP